MDTCITLNSIFAGCKEELANELKGLSLPKDSQQVINIVSDFLNNLFENDGDFRQSLTESEDFIFQASLNLLQSQQNIALEVVKASKYPESASNEKCGVEHKSAVNAYISVVGAGVGAIAGGLIGTWPAVAGAIAGTALVIYCSTRPVKDKKDHSEQPFASPQINTSVFCSIVGKICESIDGVIDTYRVQVKRIANTYEQREKPSLLSTYSSLTEQIANVIKVAKVCQNEIPSKLDKSISILEDSLENYGLKFNDGKIINV